MAKHKERHVNDLSAYKHQIIIVDDIFSLNIKDENLISSFTHFRIKEFSPSLRNKLIEKWINLTDKQSVPNENAYYKRVDNATELVNISLGRVLGNGIMPAYPFFILSIICTSETFGKPLNQEITSQGYCYQALIYLYLTNEGVKNEEIDTYINFLTEFAFYFYSQKKNEISEHEFKSFLGVYLNKYNLPINQDIIIRKLQKTQLIKLSCLGSYYFCYPYLYYFFVAKYLSDNLDSEAEKNILDSIINNLHKDENSYILLFISHHSRSIYILDKITESSTKLFEKFDEALLNDSEMCFFDKQLNNIVKEILPETSKTPEKERAKRLENQDEIEENFEDKNIDEDNDFSIELRRSIKTVEVMGLIIKNRSGSLLKEKLEAIFEEAMKVHLRILSCFFNEIKKDEVEEEFIKFMSRRVNLILKNKTKKRSNFYINKIPDGKKIEKLSRKIYWNINFIIINGLIDKIVHSLGSNTLTEVISHVCDKKNSPSHFLVKHGILMWYNKNLQIDDMLDRLSNNDFSETAKQIMKYMIVNHCSMHTVSYKERQKIVNKLEIDSKNLLKKL